MGPSGEMCNNCNYFDKHPTEFLGHCKRFPPTIPPDLFIPRPSPSGELTQMEVEQKEWLSAIVGEDDWCGEYRAKDKM